MLTLGWIFCPPPSMSTNPSNAIYWLRTSPIAQELPRNQAYNIKSRVLANRRHRMHLERCFVPGNVLVGEQAARVGYAGDFGLYHEWPRVPHAGTTPYSYAEKICAAMSLFTSMPLQCVFACCRPKPSHTPYEASQVQRHEHGC